MALLIVVKKMTDIHKDVSDMAVEAEAGKCVLGGSTAMVMD